LNKPQAARYGVENGFKMLTYCVYAALLNPFSPCLALAWDLFNALLDAFAGVIEYWQRLNQEL